MNLELSNKDEFFREKELKIRAFWGEQFLPLSVVEKTLEESFSERMTEKGWNNLLQFVYDTVSVMLLEIDQAIPKTLELMKWENDEKNWLILRSSLIHSERENFANELIAMEDYIHENFDTLLVADSDDDWTVEHRHLIPVYFPLLTEYVLPKVNKH